MYAIGGNPEAELSGVKVKAVMLFVFITMSGLSAGRHPATARLQSATTIAGVGFD